MATDVHVKDGGESAVERLREGRVYRPNVDIVEEKNELRLLADMPGVTADSIQIDFEDGVLTVQGKVAPRQIEGVCLLQEYGVGDFYRTFRVSEQIDANGIAAEYAGGVLTVHLPKAEAAKPRKIEVRTAS